MIHVDLNRGDESSVKVEGTGAEILAEICLVIFHLVEESGVDPEMIMDDLRDTYLRGHKKIHEDMEAMEGAGD